MDKTQLRNRAICGLLAGAIALGTAGAFTGIASAAPTKPGTTTTTTSDDLDSGWVYVAESGDQRSLNLSGSNDWGYAETSLADSDFFDDATHVGPRHNLSASGDDWTVVDADAIGGEVTSWPKSTAGKVADAFKSAVGEQLTPDNCAVVGSLIAKSVHQNYAALAGGQWTVAALVGSVVKDMAMKAAADVDWAAVGGKVLKSLSSGN